jgi:uncharacterized protein (TIGR00730 family)
MTSADEPSSIGQAVSPDIAAPSTPRSICVYCGSRLGADPGYEAAARELGRLIGERGWRLVYGGGKVGLMGVVADAVMQAGGTVLGVIPEHLLKMEVGHGALTELRVVQTMHERKQIMAENADAFVALPGGIGTLEELFEVWTWQHLGYHDKPIALLDTDRYWQPLLDFVAHMETEEFISQRQADLAQVHAEPGTLLDALTEAMDRAPSNPSTDYKHI